MRNESEAPIMMTFLIRRCLVGLLVATLGVHAAADPPLVIAHRGASGYLPEHTLEAKAMAYAMGADYIEQDIVLSKDDQPLVLHDIHLDTVTDVATVFPDRAREDGRYYAIDFTLAEIRQLTAGERTHPNSGQPVFPTRFPARRSSFAVPTLGEEIELIQGLNHSTGRNVGIYPEIKAPSFHRREGKDISKIVLDTLHRYGYRGRDDKCYLQCFEVAETRRIRQELNSQLRLVQLIGGLGYDQWLTPQGLQQVAEYADGIGPPLQRLIRSDQGVPRVTELVSQAQAAGLVVHPYTLRADAVPEFIDSYAALVRLVYQVAGADGAFTDFPDRTVEVLRTLAAAP